jgi:hypothetical protein
MRRAVARRHIEGVLRAFSSKLMTTFLVTV